LAQLAKYDFPIAINQTTRSFFERMSIDLWASDSVHLRRAGIPTYGAPAVCFNIDPIRAHGQDERVGVEAFSQRVEFMCRIVKPVI